MVARPARLSRVPSAVLALVLAASLGACSGDPKPDAAATPAPSAPAASAPAPGALSGAGESGGVQVRRTLASGLDVPWGVAFLPDGSALVAQRPTGEVVHLDAAGTVTPAGTVPGVADQGEGGLLGLATERSDNGSGAADGAPVDVYAYLTSTEGDNRVVRMRFQGGRLQAPEPVLTGIPSANIHNGGLVTIGPDGKLWIGTGEGGRTERAQDRSSLGGKILRINLDGSIPADNPFPGSPVYSLGHRNVQGLAFDSADRPWAVEFGQNTWDELNRILPGRNYGWPEVEGKERREGFTAPLVQWPTSEASPSGLAILDDVAYIGGLRGQRLWQVPLEGTRTGTPTAALQDRFGRIRTVAVAPGGDLWITTSNRDGRGEPRDGDDRVIDLSVGGP